MDPGEEPPTERAILKTMSEYLVSFALTLMIEAAVAAALGLRSRRSLLALVGANLITHPALWLAAPGPAPLVVAEAAAAANLASFLAGIVVLWR